MGPDRNEAIDTMSICGAIVAMNIGRVIEARSKGGGIEARYKGGAIEARNEAIAVRSATTDAIDEASCESRSESIEAVDEAIGLQGLHNSSYVGSKDMLLGKPKLGSSLIGRSPRN